MGLSSKYSCGIDCMFEPKIFSANSRTMIETASEESSVASRMALDFSEASSRKRRKGRKAMRSSPKPAIAPAASATRMTANSGGAKWVMAISPANEPIIYTSPWAKLTTLSTPKISVKPMATSA